MRRLVPSEPISAENSLGDRLRQARLQLGMTQQDLAERIGKTRSTIAGYELGTRIIDVPTLQRIAQVFDTTVGILLGEYSARPRRRGKSP